MPGRHQPHGDIADLQRLAIGERLQLAAPAIAPSLSFMMAIVSAVASTA